MAHHRPLYASGSRLGLTAVAGATLGAAASGSTGVMAAHATKQVRRLPLRPCLCARAALHLHHCHLCSTHARCVLLVRRSWAFGPSCSLQGMQARLLKSVTASCDVAMQASQQTVLFRGLRTCMAIATGVSEGKKVPPRCFMSRGIPCACLFAMGVE